jgi:AsmA-like C-terminal region
MSPSALIGSLGGSGTFTLERGRVVRLDPAAFDAVIRAVDQGLPIDATRVRDRMDAALASGVLTFASAEGALTINAGQARMSSITVRAQGADLAASGSVNLADGVIDARLSLLGAAGTGALASTRPEVAITLKGPSDAPKRSIDVAALTSWLALRAVEQQSKKLDLLEGRELPLVPPAGPAAVAPADVPQGAAPIQSAPIQNAPIQSVPQQSAPIQSAPAAEPAAPSAPKPKGTVGTGGTAAAAGHVAPPAPPVDIRPPAATRPPPKPAPAAPRSLKEILFGN